MLVDSKPDVMPPSPPSSTNIGPTPDKCIALVRSLIIASISGARPPLGSPSVVGLLSLPLENAVEVRVDGSLSWLPSLAHRPANPGSPVLCRRVLSRSWFPFCLHACRLSQHSRVCLSRGMHETNPQTGFAGRTRLSIKTMKYNMKGQADPMCPACCNKCRNKRCCQP